LAERPGAGEGKPPDLRDASGKMALLHHGGAQQRRQGS
jgi:hypothetical protein